MAEWMNRKEHLTGEPPASLDFLVNNRCSKIVKTLYKEIYFNET